MLLLFWGYFIWIYLVVTARGRMSHFTDSGCASNSFRSRTGIRYDKYWKLRFHVWVLFTLHITSPTTFDGIHIQTVSIQQNPFTLKIQGYMNWGAWAPMLTFANTLTGTETLWFGRGGSAQSRLQGLNVLCIYNITIILDALFVLPDFCRWQNLCLKSQLVGCLEHL